MPYSKRFASNPPHRAPRTQRGIVMVIVLIALVILMIGGVALIRSADTSMLTAGNLAFKRDMVNQGERGIAKVVGALTSGALSSETTRQANALGSNYSATLLPSDARGIPLVLVDSEAFTTAGMSAAADLVDATSGVTIRFVIDRQCTATGAFDAATCMTSPTASDKAGTSWIKRAGGENRPVYRISVRVIGPRRTEAYLQRTVAF